jgi:Rho-binding antiterminator
MSSYQPISCINHERLEFAVLKKQWLNIQIQKGEWAGAHRLLPLDVYARNGVEWLETQNESGEKLKLRLDEIGF